MSYCRFSGDNWHSDVYVYQDCGGGWTTHVASNRIVGDIPPEPSWDRPINANWMAEHKTVMDFLKTAARETIDLPHSGGTFNDPTPAATADRLEELRALGYHVPQYAIDELREEAASDA